MNAYGNAPIMVYIDNGNIIHIDAQQRRNTIGLTTSEVEKKNGEIENLKKILDDTITKTDEYYNMLVEHNIITKEKTQEELMGEFLSGQTKILESLEAMNNRLVILEGGKNEHQSGITNTASIKDS